MNPARLVELTEALSVAIQSINYNYSVSGEGDEYEEFEEIFNNFISFYDYTDIFSQVALDKITETIVNNPHIEDVFNKIFFRFMLRVDAEDLGRYLNNIEEVLKSYRSLDIGEQSRSLVPQEVGYTGMDGVSERASPETVMAASPHMIVLIVAMIDPSHHNMEI